MSNKIKQSTSKTYEVLNGQSIDLLKELHILTSEGKINQDTRQTQTSLPLIPIRKTTHGRSI